MSSIANRAWNNEKFRYLFIGAYNTVFGYSAFATLWYFLGHSTHYLGLLTVSHFLSVTNAYLGYRIIVFRLKGRWIKEFLRFNMVYVATFGFNLAAFFLLIENFNMHPLIAQAIIVTITIVSSYILHRRISFKK